MKIKCPACATVLSVPDSAAGKVVKCTCGKQLRAPGSAAPQQPAAQQPTGSRPATRPTSPQRPAPGAGGGGFDPGMIDELTDGDLQPVASVARPGRATAHAGSATGGKLLQQYASGDVRVSGATNQIAGAGTRLAGAIVDGLLQMLGVGIGIGCLVAIGVVTEGSDVGAIIGFVLLGVFALIPVIINAVLIAKSGQTVGKKVVKTRIVIEATGQLPGFAKGWLVRTIVFGMIAQFVPFLPLIDALFVFSEDAKTLHDRLAGTVVVTA